MGDALDKFIEKDDWRKEANPMERKKLRVLNEKAEEQWQICNDLEKERNKLRFELTPNHHKELQELKDKRDKLLNIKTEEARKIKEDRKLIRLDFLIKTKHIREDRKEQLKSNPELSSNLKNKNNAWEEHRKFQKKFWEYIQHLKEKYAVHAKDNNIGVSE